MTEQERRRYSFRIADVVNILRTGTPVEQYEITRFFPALVNALLADPMGAFIVTFGHNHAHWCERKVRVAIGVTSAESTSEAAPEQPVTEPAPAQAPASKPVATSEKKKGSKRKGADKQGPRGEDSVDEVLNQVGSQTAPETVGEAEED